MEREVAEISLFPHGESSIGISLIYNQNPSTDITHVLVERYEVPKRDLEKVAGIRDVISQQSVLQYMGGEAARMSKEFQMGGGDIFTDANMIDITSGVEQEFPLIIDDGADRDENLYVYRLLNYGQNYESSTRYVVGLELIKPVIDNEDLPDSHLIAFMDRDEIEDILPENTDSLITWANERSLFLETYRLRERGEIPEFKFSSYLTRAWIDLVFIKELEKKAIAAIDKAEEELT